MAFVQKGARMGSSARSAAPRTLGLQQRLALTEHAFPAPFTSQDAAALQNI